MRPASDSLDTGEDVAAMVFQYWRSSTVAERADMVRRLCADVERLARSRISAERPGLSELEVCKELARRRYGAALADAAFAERLSGG